MKTEIYKLYLKKEEDLELPYDITKMTHLEILRDIALRREINQRSQEVLLMVAWKSDTQIAGIFELGVGSSYGVTDVTKEIFQAALLCNATAIGLIHNHPGGDAMPSTKDKTNCLRLRDIGDILRISLVEDAVINFDGDISSILNAALLK